MGKKKSSQCHLLLKFAVRTGLNPEYIKVLRGGEILSLLTKLAFLKRLSVDRLLSK